MVAREDKFLVQSGVERPYCVQEFLEIYCEVLVGVLKKWRMDCGIAFNSDEGVLPFNVCAVKAGAFQWETDPPGNWFVPPGNNRSGGGGDKAVGAFDVKGRLSGSVSM